MSVCSDLLAPFDARRFLDEVFERRALHIAGERGKFHALYSIVGDRWLEFAEELEAAEHVAGGGQRQFRIPQSEVTAHFNRGMTICANVTRDPTLTPTLRRFASELGLAGAPFAKLYASPDTHGFSLHLDSFHVFVCQLHGQKRWRYSATPAVVAPIYSGKVVGGRAVWSGGDVMTDDLGTEVAAPDEGALAESLLSEGDCLYLPPGTWHVARAVGRSVALSISPPRTPIYQLVAKVLEEHLVTRAAWRRDVFAPISGEEAVPTAVARTFQERIDDLRSVLDGLDQRTLHRVWRINAPTADHSEPVEPFELGENVVMRPAGDSVRRYLVAPTRPFGPDAVHFYAHGSEWSLPITALPFIEALAAREAFTLADARAFDPRLGEEDVRQILSELITAGLLRHHDA